MNSSAPTARAQQPRQSKTPVSLTDSMRQNRVLAPEVCRDTRSKLENLRRLIMATEVEYRNSIRDLDRLNNEGRVWLVVDLIHKTSIASLDLAANLIGIVMKDPVTAKAASTISNTTQTLSDYAITQGNLANGSASALDVGKTVAGIAIRHSSGHAKGTADILMTGAGGLENIVSAKGTPQQGTRTAEAGIETMATMIQRTADQTGGPVAEKVGAAAGIAKAMSTYNRELEGAFNRRLEIRSGLMSSRALLESQMRRHMDRFRKDAAKLESLLAGCM